MRRVVVAAVVVVVVVVVPLLPLPPVLVVEGETRRAPAAALAGVCVWAAAGSCAVGGAA